MRAKRVNENIKFERGLDPRESMGIGDEEIQMINKLDRLASKYGFEKVPLDPEDEKEGIRNIQRWYSNENECQILLYDHDDWKSSGYWLNYEDLFGSGNDPVEQWLNPQEWEDHYGEDAWEY